MTLLSYLNFEENHLLKEVLEIEGQHWPATLEKVELSLGQVLHEPGSPLRHAYFPTTATVALLSLLENGASIEIAMVGNEGMIDVPLFTGGQSTLSRTVVLSAGQAYRVNAVILRDDSYRIQPLLHSLLGYTQALITQISQHAVCNRYHLLEQQFCRCLLECLDRIPGDDLMMTHSRIANLLGVRREGVTEAANRLQAAGLIRYSRGHITVIDRLGLEDHSCECYGIIKEENERNLSQHKLNTSACRRTATADKKSCNSSFLP